MKLSDLQVDVDRIEQGSWVDVPGMGNVRLKVRGSDNSDFRKLQERLSQAVPRGKRIGGIIDADEREAILSQCLIETVLLDWDGIVDDDGKPVPYSKELAATFLTDPRFRLIRNAVVWAASVVGEGRQSDREVDAKN